MTIHSTFAIIWSVYRDLFTKISFLLFHFVLIKGSGNFDLLKQALHSRISQKNNIQSNGLYFPILSVT